MIKTYVLDTNVLMTTEGRVLFGFDDNNVVITDTTLEELDKFKMAPMERGYQAREAIRAVKKIIEEKSDKETISKGIKLPNGGTFKIVTNHLLSELPKGWTLDNPDNRILCTCKSLAEESQSKRSKTPVILITNDVSMAIKAQTIDISVQGYRNDNIDAEETEYTGRATFTVSVEDLDLLYDRGEIDCPAEANIPSRQYLLIKDITESRSALGYYLDGKIKLIRHPDNSVFGLTPKNIAQKFALHALLAPAEEIPLVILKGCAGTGKTLLSIAAGLSKAYDWEKDGEYGSVVITRSNTLSDEELGFLPGSLEDKMTPLLSPFIDNLKFLLGKKGEERREINIQIEDMIETGVIEITSLAYVRGRSLNNTFLIVDECQNLTRLQAKTLVTRIGQGSKLVILGDPNQIDNPKLDKKNNGLVYLAEKFKDSPLCAEIAFDESESVRSELAKDAIYRLN